MPFKSPFPDLEIPNTNVLSYLFPSDSEPSDRPIWIDSQDTSKHLSPKQLLVWVKRLAVGFDKVGVKKDEVVMIFTPNHIFLPVAYLGIVGSGRAFSGANPVYTVPGMKRSAVLQTSLKRTQRWYTRSRTPRQHSSWFIHPF